MSNQHAGAPALKGGLLQPYQLRARCARLRAEPEPGLGVLDAAARLQSSAAPLSPCCHPLLCAAAMAGDGRKGGEAESRTLRIANICVKLFPALQVRRCIPAFTASHGKACKKQAVCALFNSSSCCFDLCACLCLCRQHLYSSSAAPGQGFLSQTNLMAVSFPAVLSSH